MGLILHYSHCFFLEAVLFVSLIVRDITHDLEMI